MFDPSLSELILVFVIGLLILGPKRLPKVASQIGRWVGRARRTAAQLRHQLEREIALSEIAENQKRRASAASDARGPRAESTAAAEAPGPEPGATAHGPGSGSAGRADEKSQDPPISG